MSLFMSLIDFWSGLTWVRQDGVGLGQELVTADPLVTLSTPGTERGKELTQRLAMVLSQLNGAVAAFQACNLVTFQFVLTRNIS